jgi:hypothetical protein
MEISTKHINIIVASSVHARGKPNMLFVGYKENVNVCVARILRDK